MYEALSIGSVPVGAAFRDALQMPPARLESSPRPITTVAVVDFMGFLQDYISTFFRMPRVGPVLMGTILHERGLNVRVFSETVAPLDSEAIDYICSAGLVAMSVLTFGANRAYALAGLIRRVNPTARILMGDVHPTIMPEHCLQHCDFVIRDEGDETIGEFLSALQGEPDAPAWDAIRGLSYWRDGRIVHNPKRERPKNIGRAANLDLVEKFIQPDVYSLVKQGKLSMAVLQASRGCPVACKFCLGSAILGKGYRTRDIELVIENLHHIRRISGGDRRVTFIVDNHFFIDRNWTKALLRRIIEERIKLQFIAFGQYFVGRDPEMLDLLREAGFIRIFCGLESINAQTLREYNKNQSEDAMRECIAAMQEHGVRVHGSFMLGGETDTMETVERTIRFALETEIDSASFYALCEYPFENHEFVPNTQMLPPHRLLPDNLDYYNLNFVSIYPKCMRPSQLQRGLIDAHERFFSWTRLGRSLAGLRFDLARMRGMTLWGHYRLIRQMRAYLPYLEEREEGKYDHNDQLIESALGREPLVFDAPPPPIYDSLFTGGMRVAAHAG